MTKHGLIPSEAQAALSRGGGSLAGSLPRLPSAGALQAEVFLNQIPA